LDEQDSAPKLQVLYRIVSSRSFGTGITESTHPKGGQFCQKVNDIQVTFITSISYLVKSVKIFLSKKWIFPQKTRLSTSKNEEICSSG